MQIVHVPHDPSMTEDKAVATGRDLIEGDYVDDGVISVKRVQSTPELGGSEEWEIAFKIKPRPHS
jgi:hypothetical protein